LASQGNILCSFPWPPIPQLGPTVTEKSPAPHNSWLVSSRHFAWKTAQMELTSVCLSMFTLQDGWLFLSHIWRKMCYYLVQENELMAKYHSMTAYAGTLQIECINSQWTQYNLIKKCWVSLLVIKINCILYGKVDQNITLCCRKMVNL